MRRRSRYRVNHAGHLLGTVLTGGLWGIAWAADTASKQNARTRRDAANVLPPDWYEIRRRVYKRDRGICRWCRSAVPWTSYHCDHIFPRSLGGHPSDTRNLQTLCNACNLRKGARIIPGMVGVWLPGRDPINNPHLQPTSAAPAIRSSRAPKSNRTASPRTVNRERNGWTPVNPSRAQNTPVARPGHLLAADATASPRTTQERLRPQARVDVLRNRDASVEEVAANLSASGMRGAVVLSDIRVQCDQAGCTNVGKISRRFVHVDGVRTSEQLYLAIVDPLILRGWWRTRDRRNICPRNHHAATA